jgi:hypothetical protein
MRDHVQCIFQRNTEPLWTQMAWKKANLDVETVIDTHTFTRNGIKQIETHVINEQHEIKQIEIHVELEQPISVLMNRRRTYLSIKANPDHHRLDDGVTSSRTGCWSQKSAVASIIDKGFGVCNAV